MRLVSIINKTNTEILNSLLQCNFYSHISHVSDFDHFEYATINAFECHAQEERIGIDIVICTD